MYICICGTVLGENAYKMEQFHQQGSRGVTVIVGNRMDVESGSEVKFPFRVSHSVEVK